MPKLGSRGNDYDAIVVIIGLVAWGIALVQSVAGVAAIDGDDGLIGLTLVGQKGYLQAVPRHRSPMAANAQTTSRARGHARRSAAEAKITAAIAERAQATLH